MLTALINESLVRDRTAVNFATARLANELVAIAERLTRADAISHSPQIDGRYVRKIIASRRAREKIFGQGLFSDPAWDILLDLTAARLDGEVVAVTSLCIAANVPTTTALRWIKSMVVSDLLERRADPDDGRRSYVVITDATFQNMMTCLETGRAEFADITRDQVAN